MGRVVVIGSGLSGLATAIRLRSSGHEVVVLERAAEPAETLGRVCQGSFFFDAEPGCLLLPQILADLFAAADQRLDDYIDLLPVDPIARYLFPDGAQFDLWSRPDRLRDEVKRLSESEAAHVDRFLRAGRRFFQGLSKGPWRQPQAHWTDTLRGFVHPGALLRLPWLWDVRRATSLAKRHWREPHLRRVFGSFAMELGASPLHAPAAANWPAFALCQFGAWYPRGGMFGLRRALLRVADVLGIDIRCGVSVEELALADRKAVGVITQEGRTLSADAVVGATDPVALLRQTLHPDDRPLQRFQRRWQHREASFSRFAFLWGCNQDWPLLAHRTVLFSEDPHSEFLHLRTWRVGAPEPTLTLLHPARTDPELAPKGQTALTAMIAAPVLSPRWQWNDAQRAGLRTDLLDRLRARGIDGLREAIVAEHDLPPAVWKTRFRRYHGACHGTATHSFGGLFRRFPHRHPRIGGLYFAGPWTVPGPTFPQVLIGAKLVTQLISRDLHAN